MKGGECSATKEVTYQHQSSDSAGREHGSFNWQPPHTFRLILHPCRLTSVALYRPLPFRHFQHCMEDLLQATQRSHADTCAPRRPPAPQGVRTRSFRHSSPAVLGRAGPSWAVPGRPGPPSRRAGPSWAVWVPIRAIIFGSAVYSACCWSPRRSLATLPFLLASSDPAYDLSRCSLLVAP